MKLLIIIVRPTKIKFRKFGMVNFLNTSGLNIDSNTFIPGSGRYRKVEEA